MAPRGRRRKHDEASLEVQKKRARDRESQRRFQERRREKIDALEHQNVELREENRKLREAVETAQFTTGWGMQHDEYEALKQQCVYWQRRAHMAEQQQESADVMIAQLRKVSATVTSVKRHACELIGEHAAVQKVLSVTVGTWSKFRDPRELDP